MPVTRFGDVIVDLERIVFADYGGAVPGGPGGRVLKLRLEGNIGETFVEGEAARRIWDALCEHVAPAPPPDVEESLAALAVVKMAQAEGRWSGTMGELLEEVLNWMGRDANTDPSRPRTPRGLSALLRRYATSLEREGVVVTDMGRGEDGRRVSIAWRPPSSAS